MDTEQRQPLPIAGRFRGFLPVVVDVETGGFDPQRHAL
ncbi:MAG: ribonuclease T, partial [Thiohalocapsa sp.]